MQYWVPSYMEVRSALWRSPDFLRLWTGQTISETCSRITRDGLPLTAVMTLRATEGQMGLLWSLGGFATLIAGPAAGVLCDRYRRRRLMIVADIARAALLVTVPIAAAAGLLSLAQLYAVAALAGALTVAFDTAYHSYLPSLVERNQIQEGNAKLALSGGIAEMTGPALTGLLVQTITAPRAILIDALSFLLSAISLAWIRLPEPRPRGGHAELTWREAAEGFRAVAAHPLLLPFALRSLTISLFFGMMATLYHLYAIRDLNLQPAVYGVIVALGGVSNFTGAMIAERLARRVPLGRLFVGSAVLFGLAQFLLPLADGPWYRVLACLAGAQLLGDGAFTLFWIHELTLRQSVTPPSLLGRVNACMQLTFKGPMPFGALAGGWLATRFGIRTTLAIAAAGILLSAAWIAFSAPGRLRRHFAPHEQQHERDADQRHDAGADQDRLE